MKGLANLAYFVLVVIVLMCVYVGIQIKQAQAHVDAYSKLQLGQKRDLVEENFGRPPEASYEIDRCSCVYYEGGFIFAHPVKLQVASLRSLDKLPFFYDSIQILFDDEEKVIAFSWLGEGGTSSVAGENSNRSNIVQLPPEILAALKERCKQ